jgi:hypothetical protein
MSLRSAHRTGPSCVQCRKRRVLQVCDLPVDEHLDLSDIPETVFAYQNIAGCGHRRWNVWETQIQCASLMQASALRARCVFSRSSLVLLHSVCTNCVQHTQHVCKVLASCVYTHLFIQNLFSVFTAKMSCTFFLRHLVMSDAAEGGTDPGCCRAGTKSLCVVVEEDLFLLLRGPTARIPGEENTF